MGEFALSKRLFPSKESLARKLCKDLESYGVIYHSRTLKRQISGFIATVPSEVQSALAKIVFSQQSGVDIRQLCAEAGISCPNGNDSPAYVPSGKVLPLAQLWLHLNPHASKRALAIRLQRDIEKRGISYTVDTLEAILAGRNRLFVRPVIGDRLVEYLQDVGVNSREEAEARIQAQAEIIRQSLDSREFVPIRRFHGLCSHGRRRRRLRNPPAGPG
jgi:nucleoid DNA-binding protein